jgi:hypothetical protein
MGTATGLLAEARRTLGLGESPAGSNHNKITVWYNANIMRIGDGAWCNMSVSYWAAHSGNLPAIGAGRGIGYAYTVWHAEKFQRIGRWHYGTGGIRAGDVVFFDWSRTRSIGKIDHVGVVERVRGGVIYTIEGNKADRCVRVARDGKYIVGYGRPAYTAPEPEPVEDTLKTLVDLGARDPQTIPAGERGSLSFELEYLDEGKIHTDAKDGARYPSIFPKDGDAPYAVTVQLVLDAKPADGVVVSLASYDRDSNDWVRDVRFEDVLAPRHIMHANLRMSDKHKYRADIVNDSGVDVVVNAAYLLIAH